jgi:hypothetical protein
VRAPAGGDVAVDQLDVADEADVTGQVDGASVTTSMMRAKRPSYLPTRTKSRSTCPFTHASPIRRQPVMSGCPATGAAGGGAAGPGGGGAA